VNSIVTRGMGSNTRLITRGYGIGIAAALVKDVVKAVKGSAKEAKEQVERTLVVVRAALVEANNNEIKNVEGTSKGIISSTNLVVTAKVIFSSVRKGLKEIFIRALSVSSKRHRSD